MKRLEIASSKESRHWHDGRQEVEGHQQGLEEGQQEGQQEGQLEGQLEGQEGHQESQQEEQKKREVGLRVSSGLVTELCVVCMDSTGSKLVPTITQQLFKSVPHS